MSFVSIARGVYTGIAAALLVTAARAAVGARPDLDAAVVAFLLVAPTYAPDAASVGPPRRTARGFVVGCSVALLAMLCARQAFGALVACAGLLSAGVAYASWLKPITRVVPGFKTVFVAACWATLVPLGAVVARRELGSAALATTLFVFLQLLVNVAVCDLKDLDDDRRRRLRTLALVVGAERLLLLAQAANVLSAALVVVALAAGVLPNAAGRLVLFCVWTAASIPTARRRRGALFYALVVDGVLVWPALLSAVVG